MTLTKKLLATSISIFAIAGMMLMAHSAQAGFFDWFNKTPLNQEAAAIRTVQKVDVQASSKTSDSGTVYNPVVIPDNSVASYYCTGTVVNGVCTNGDIVDDTSCKNFPAQCGGWTPLSVSGGGTVYNPVSVPEKTNFLENIFSRLKSQNSAPQAETQKAMTQPGNLTIPVQPSVSRVNNGGTVYNPNTNPTGIDPSNAIWVSCSGSASNPACQQAGGPCYGYPIKWNSETSEYGCDTSYVQINDVLDTVPGSSTADVVYCGDGFFWNCEELQILCEDNGGLFENDLAEGACYGDFFITSAGGDSNPLPTFPVYEFDKEISKGDTGSEVIKLQNALKSLGYYTGRVDGVYGSGTSASVKAFQRASGQLLTTGNVVGPKTREALNNAVSGGKVSSGGTVFNPSTNPTGIDIDNAWIDFGDGDCYSTVAGAWGVIGSATAGSAGTVGSGWCVGEGWAEYNFSMVIPPTEEYLTAAKNVLNKTNLPSKATQKQQSVIKKMIGSVSINGGSNAWIDFGDGDCFVEGVGWGTIPSVPAGSCQIWTPESITWFF